MAGLAQAPGSTRARRGYLALFLVLAGSSELLKGVFARTHPVDPGDVSFPSTHVAMVTAAVLVVVGVLSRFSARRQDLPALLVALIIVTTAATRVMLGEHYLTDVIATGLGYTLLALAGIGLLGAVRRPLGPDASAPPPS